MGWSSTLLLIQGNNMCEPTTIMLAISAVGAGMSYVGGQQNASNAAKAANDSTKLGYQQENERLSQVNDQSALDKSERIKQGLLERAKASTIAGESGALGISSDRLILDSFMQEGTDMASLEKNRLNQGKQSAWSKKRMEADGQSSINTAYGNAPTLISTGLQIGAAGMEYSTAKTEAKNKAKAVTA
jgi:hypothetical protein